MFQNNMKGIDMENVYVPTIGLKLDRASLKLIKNKLKQLDQQTAQNIKRLKEEQHAWEDEFVSAGNRGDN